MRSVESPREGTDLELERVMQAKRQIIRAQVRSVTEGPDKQEAKYYLVLHMFTSNEYGHVGRGGPVPVLLREDIIPHQPQGVRCERGPWELIRYGIQGLHDCLAPAVRVQLQQETGKICFNAELETGLSRMKPLTSLI